MATLVQCLKVALAIIVGFGLSIVSTLVSTLAISTVEGWDDAPGNGIFILLVAAWTVTAAFILGIVASLPAIRTNNMMRVFSAVSSGILAAALMPTALLLFADGIENKQQTRYLAASIGLAVAIVLLSLLTARLLSRNPVESKRLQSA